MQQNKILIIQTAFIGDVILVTPLIRATRACFADGQLDLMVIPAALNLVENNPSLDKVIVYDKRGKQAGLSGFLAMAKQVRKAKYDMVLVPHRSMRSAFLAWWSGAKIRVGFNTSAGSFLFTHQATYVQSLHEIERNLSLLKALGYTAGHIAPELFGTIEDQQVVDKVLVEIHASGKPLVAVAPGSVWATKRWPEGHYHRLLNMLSAAHYAIILLGGAEDKKLCQRIASGVDGLVINSAGELSLRQTALILKQAQALVTNDSAPLHLGSAANVPIVAIFGPTITGFGFYPYSDYFSIVEMDLGCRPCGIHGGQKCPIGTHACMTQLSAENVFHEIITIIKQKTNHERNNKNKPPAS